mmetsp:Transcript_24183/g.51350  ORF Transcript_24183/g.51350 Transcript_24183/m.51350 type:complete len:301 (-) Transcript_24183:731-1633(-)
MGTPPRAESMTLSVLALVLRLSLPPLLLLPSVAGATQIVVVSSAVPVVFSLRLPDSVFADRDWRMALSASERFEERTTTSLLSIAVLSRWWYLRSAILVASSVVISGGHVAACATVGVSSSVVAGSLDDDSSSGLTFQVTVLVLRVFLTVLGMSVVSRDAFLLLPRAFLAGSGASVDSGAALESPDAFLRFRLDAPPVAVAVFAVLAVRVPAAFLVSLAFGAAMPPSLVVSARGAFRFFLKAAPRFCFCPGTSKPSSASCRRSSSGRPETPSSRVRRLLRPATAEGEPPPLVAVVSPARS